MRKFVFASLILWMLLVTAYVFQDARNNALRDQILKSLVFRAMI